MTTSSRRTFLKTGATVAGAVALTSVLPRPLLATLGSHPEPVPPITDPRLKELAFRGVESARAAGATYADVRLTHTWFRSISSDVSDRESMTVGVRALVNGYWGFASGPVWSPDELARLGREAVHQARTNALGKTRVVELAPVAPVHDQHWVMPVARDPFTVSPYEIQDFLLSIREHFARRPETRPPRAGVRVTANFVMQEKAFASAAGSYCTQRVYRTSGRNPIRVVLEKEHKEITGSVDCLTPAGLGWELFTADRIPQVRDHTLIEEIALEVEELIADGRMPIKPVEVGRYDTVFDPQSVAMLVDGTLGRATELDRALGFEANAGGTSYLNKPLEMLGTYQAGAAALTLAAERSTAGAVGTVRWDDEGVAPDEFHLVKDGVLSDFQTTRESAGWLADYYTKLGAPVRSHGCALAPEGVDAPLQHTPNLLLAPGKEASAFDDLVAGLKDGIAIKGIALNMDFQNVSGMGQALTAYEVKKGKRTAIIAGAGFLFRAPELWKGLLTLGGAASTRRYGIGESKGQPAQTGYYSVTVPPAVFKELTLIDPLRKA